MTLMQTTTTVSLPPEIVDTVIDHLHDEPTALRVSSLVSKSWAARSRTHLFAHVVFNHKSVKSWMKTFPDPLNSPAHYTRSLSLRGHQLVALAGPAPRIRAFPFDNLVNLNIHSESNGSGGDRVSLVLFHGLSPTVRSLHLTLPNARPSEVFEFVCSFPLLEDLSLFAFGYSSVADRWTPPSTPPRLTGSLQLHNMDGGIDPITCRLLDLPNGLNFTKIVVSRDNDETDSKSITDLVSGCSNTLESLDVTDYFPGKFPSFPAPDRYLTTFPLHSDFSTAASFNLSTATKLKHLVFRCGRQNVQWITEALQTVESKTLQQITVWPDFNSFPLRIAEPYRQQWHDLDRLLIQFWDSHSIRPKVTYKAGVIRKDTREYAPGLLPELTERGLVDLVDCGR